MAPLPARNEETAADEVGVSAEEAPQPRSRSHDWRSPGFVSVVGGRLYDPSCFPLQSVGSNVPNLPFRPGLEENLEWMRLHGFRWMRVFATGHDLGEGRAPRSAAEAAAALRGLLQQVERFNAAHPSEQAIFVLVSLTDYYQTGVPGDRQAFDHPVFRASPVLPAPWYRAGVHSFDFEQEHGFGWLYDLPNYEVNYKPWVQEIVGTLADSPALLGWQLGNELKARNSPRNGITPTQAYEWYRAFTADMVDTIRARDRNHLIAAGLQYIAELVDWEYRPGGDPDPELVPEYRKLVERMLEACGTYCWNLSSLTMYDFNLYPFDDAAAFAAAGAATIATEYGFTRGSPSEMEQRFGGDRPSAVLNGLARAWTPLDAAPEPRLPGVLELARRHGVAGIAPWGTPAPEPYAGFDADGERGVTSAPDESALWRAWQEVARQVNAANQAAGRSSDCVAFDSTLQTQVTTVIPVSQGDTLEMQPTEEVDGS